MRSQDIIFNNGQFNDAYFSSFDYFPDIPLHNEHFEHTQVCVVALLPPLGPNILPNMLVNLVNHFFDYLPPPPGR